MNYSRTLAEMTAMGIPVPTPGVGDYIVPDNWQVPSELVASDWDRAQFYIKTNNGGPITQVAVNVSISGRVAHNVDHRYWRVRVKVVFVKDDDPDINHAGWFYFRT